MPKPKKTDEDTHYAKSQKSDSLGRDIPKPKPRKKKEQPLAIEPVAGLPTPVAMPMYEPPEPGNLFPKVTEPMPTQFETARNKIGIALTNAATVALTMVSDAAKALKEHLQSDSPMKSAPFSTVEISQALAICIGAGIVLGSQPAGSMCDLAAIAAIAMSGYFCVRRRWTPQQ